MIKMSMQEWKSIHKDFKTIIDGVRYVMKQCKLVRVEILKGGSK